MVPPALLFGKKFRKALGFVREAERWSADRAREYQLRQLRNICSLAYAETTYYREAFDIAGLLPEELRCLDDLSAIPTISKDVVAEHLEEMCAVSPRSIRAEYGSTAGTSGTPLHFYMPADRSFTEYAYLTVGWERAGYTLGMPMAVIRGRVVEADGKGFRHEYDPLLRHHYYSCFHMTDDSMGRYLEHIARIGPCVLHAYPSSATSLACFIRRHTARSPSNIRAVLLESEILYPDQREMLEEVFGVRVFSSYGHSEKLVLAAHCEHSYDYHVWPTYGYFELLDDDDNPVRTRGLRGEIVGTGFINTVVPFIRYRTGDYATYVGERCEACGREHTVIGDIRGHRTQEVLVAEDGSEISWTALNMHDDTFMHVRQFQFHQDMPGRATLRIVPAEGFCEADRVRIVGNLGKKFDSRLEIEIRCVDAIDLTPRGKAIYVDQQIPQHEGKAWIR